MNPAPPESVSGLDPRLLRLHPADNVLTAIATLEPGSSIRIDADTIPVHTKIPLGHKIAARSITRGERIIKYGAPIGSATADIPAGSHVHTHNLKSDYLPTYLREDQSRYFAGREQA